MKYLVSLFIAVFLGFSSLALAFEVPLNINGFVTLTNSGYLFIDSSTQKRFVLKPGNQSVSEDLKKLSNFDSITGKATAIKGGSEEVLLLDSIDFVGLRNLLGLWKSRGTVLDFIDYNEVSFYFPSLRHQRYGKNKVPTKKASYRYSVSPTTSDSWRVFFASDESVVLGSLNIKGSKAVIEIYDVNTGEISETYSLEKVNP